MNRCEKSQAYGVSALPSLAPWLGAYAMLSQAPTLASKEALILTQHPIDIFNHPNKVTGLQALGKPMLL